MKRFWQTSLAIAASAMIAGTANAQSDWTQSGEVGSYQSIVARAGYGSSTKLPSQQAVPSVTGQEPAKPVSAEGQPTQGCVGGNCGSVVSGVSSDCGCVGACGGGCGGGVSSRLKGLFSCNDGSCGDGGSNYVVGIRGLFFQRDSEDDVRITRNGAGDVLLSTSSQYNTMGGIRFFIDQAKR